MPTVINAGLQIDVSSIPPTAPLRRDPQFKRDVEVLFGTSHPRVVQAVEGLLERRPGTLDHHRLRFIAAAAPSFADPNHVGYMIDQLATTQTDVALESLDVETAREQFEAALGGYRPETARKLVLDLVRGSTLQILEDMPAERVGEGGQHLLDEQLLKKVNSGADEFAGVAASPHLSSGFAEAVLDHAEAKVVRAETGSDGSPPRRPNIDEIHRYLGIILGEKLMDKVEDHQLDRAWQLFERCEPSENGWQIPLLVATKPRMAGKYGEIALERMKQHGRSVSEDYQRMTRGDMLNMPGLPERVALQAVRRGTTSDRFLRGDARLHLVRLARYKKSNELLPAMTTDELDLAFAKLPFSDLHAGPVLISAVKAMRDPIALEAIVDRSPKLDDRACSALVGNPAMTPDLIKRLVDNHLADTSWTRSRYGFPERLHAMFGDSNVDDTRLSRLVSTANVNGSADTTIELSKLAAHNPSAGALVFDRLVTTLDRLRETKGLKRWQTQTLEIVATETPSPYIHAALADLALKTNDESIARELMANGTIHNDVWQRFPANPSDVVVGLDSLRSGIASSGRHAEFPPYTARDVATLVISGDAPPDRADAIVRALLESPDQNRAASEIAAISMLADAGMLSEDAKTQLSGCRDRHVALRFASRPDFASCTSGFRQSAKGRLEATAEAIAREIGDRPPEKGLRSWDQLQSLDDLPLTRTPIHALLDGRQIGDLTLRVPRTRRELNNLGERMNNCLDGYGESIEQCSNVVAFADDGPETYAVMWSVDRQKTTSASSGIRMSDAVPSTAAEGYDPESCVELRIIEMNSKRNENRVPAWFEQQLQELTSSVNNGTVEPVVDHQQVGHHEREVGSATTEPARRRPLPRRPVPGLAPPSVDASAQSAAAPQLDPPSLLGAGFEGANSDVPTTATTEDVLTRSTEIPDASTPDNGHCL